MNVRKNNEFLLSQNTRINFIIQTKFSKTIKFNMKIENLKDPFQFLMI